MIDHSSKPTTRYVQSAHWEALDAAVRNVLRQRPNIAPLSTHSPTTPVIQAITEHNIQSVPIYKITGDSSRYADLDSVMYTHNTAPTVPRFEHNKRLADETPIALYLVGDTYVVKDGHVRVARARSRGQVFLPAHVTEYTFRSQQSYAQARELILREERRAFMHATGLPLHHEHTLVCSALGSYDQLMLHILSCQNDLVAEEASLETLAAVWYNRVYMPMYSLFSRHSVTDWLPNRSVADVYLWAMDYRQRTFNTWNAIGADTTPQHNQLHLRVSAALRDAAELLRIAREHSR